MNKKKKDDKLNILMAIFIAIIIIWIISIFILSNKLENWTERGTFGDSFGAINSLFSGLAFGGIIYTILLQRKELKLQREEIVLTRKELKRTANAQEKANKFQYEQLRIANIPIFQYETISSGEKSFLFITNESENIAFDIDIWFFIPVFEEDFEKKEFIQSFVQEDSKEILNENLVDNEQWAIAERGIYTSFPNDSRIVIPIEYPNKIYGIEMYGIEMYIQYRDSLNNNYSLKITFLSSENKRRPFVTSDFEPKVLVVTDRIDLTDKNLTKNFMPEYGKRIFDLNKSSIFTGHLTGLKSSSVESKWNLSKLRKK